MEPKMDSDGSVIDVLRSHVSVRAFLDQPLPDGLIETLVEAGTRASTSSNMQMYTVISITDQDLKKHVAELAADQTQIHQSAAFLVFCADLHKVTLACEMRGVNDVDCGYAEALLRAVIDAALVMQNVAVAAESMGLGICMIGAVRNHPQKIAEALGLPMRVMALSGLCIGYPTEKGETKPRLPLEATLHQNRYQSDEKLRNLISDYDETQSRWYEERKMHVRDARWSAVMSRRWPDIRKREEVSRFLNDQQLNTR